MRGGLAKERTRVFKQKARLMKTVSDMQDIDKRHLSNEGIRNGTRVDRHPVWNSMMQIGKQTQHILFRRDIHFRRKKEKKMGNAVISTFFGVNMRPFTSHTLAYLILSCRRCPKSRQ